MFIGVDGRRAAVAPLFFLLGLQRQRFDRPDAVDRLHQAALPPPFRLVQRVQPSLERLDERCDDQRHQPRETEHDEGQFYTI